MGSTLLARHPRMATTDLDRARSEVAATFCPHQLSLMGRGGELDMTHNGAAVAGVSLNFLRYGDEVRITPGRFKDFFLVQIPLGGTARVKTGDRIVASDRHYASMPSPDQPVDMVWSADCEQLIVYLRRDAVEAFASAQVPGESAAAVEFDPLVNLDTPAMRTWLRLVTLAREELEHDDTLITNPAAATHYEQVLIATLLASQPNNTMIWSPPKSGSGATRAVRIAVDLMLAQPDHPWQVSDLAARAGVSSRTLQEAFRRDRDVSPLEELRRIRLDRAHADLLAGTPATTSVSEVACRWGFFHLGRFSQTYRVRYQQLPSQTLS